MSTPPDPASGSPTATPATPPASGAATPRKTRLWVKVLLGFVVIIGLLVALVAMQPDTFAITRSITINAPATTVYPLVNHFQKWDQWSPWEKLDPQMEQTFSGAESGAGSIYEWNGNDQVGQGRMTIEKSVPHQQIGIKLEFIKPFAATNQTEFQFAESEGQTLVTWTMNGKHNFISKAMCLMMNMDDMIGKDFEKGLADMKSAAEKAAVDEPASAQTDMDSSAATAPQAESTPEAKAESAPAEGDEKSANPQ